MCSIQGEAGKNKKKYTNPANGILDFCWSKSWIGPSLCANSAWTGVYLKITGRVWAVYVYHHEYLSNSKLNFLQCCTICMSVAQYPSIMRNAKVGCAMSRCLAKVPNPAAISYCNADYSVRHLNENNGNENNKNRKLVQTLKSPPPLREGPNKRLSEEKMATCL